MAAAGSSAGWSPQHRDRRRNRHRGRAPCAACDHRERRRGLAPIVDARALEMHDLDMHAALLGDGDGFLDRLDHFVRFIAQVGEICRRCGA